MTESETKDYRKEKKRIRQKRLYKPGQECHKRKKSKPKEIKQNS